MTERENKKMKTTTIAEIKNCFDKIISTNLSKSWDNDGLTVDINSDKEVKKVVIALDATSNALAYAKKVGANLVITHHSLVFDKLSSVSIKDSVGKRVIYAAQNDISVLSFHTRLDAMRGGVNDALVEKLGGNEIGIFADGVGRIMELPFKMSPQALKTYLKEKLNTQNICIYPNHEIINTIALIGGGGKGYIKEAYETGADAYLTGEVTHSAIIDAKELGLTLCTGTHYATEAVVLEQLKEILQAEFPEVPCDIYYEYENF